MHEPVRGTLRSPRAKRWLRGAAGASIGGLVLVALINAGESEGSGDRGGQVIRYKAVTVEAAEVDHGDPGPSLGDQLVFSDELRRSGKTIGHNGGSCALTSLMRGEYLCVSSARLNGEGTITGQFFFPPAGSSNKVRIAITGGTGRYGGAGGQGVAVIRSETVADVTLRLR